MKFPESRMLNRLWIFIIVSMCSVTGVLGLDVDICMCDGETQERTLFVQLYSSAEVTFCIESLSLIENVYFLNSRDQFFGRSAMESVYATRTPGPGQSQYLVAFHVRNVTAAVYTTHRVLVHNDDGRQLTLRVTLKRPGIHFTKQRTVGNIYVGRDFKLLCERNSPIRKNLTIYKLHETQQKLRTFHENEKLVYEVDSASCQDMGRYFCVSDDDTKWQDVEINNCPPVTCTNEHPTATYTASVGSGVVVTLCAMAFPGLEDTIRVDNQLFDVGEDHPYISFNWTRDGLYNLIDIEFANITEDDFREHEASVSTRDGRLNFYFRFQKKETLVFSLVNNSSLSCVSSQYPRLVAIYKFDREQPVASTSDHSGIKESLTLSYQLLVNECSSMGMYECNSIEESGLMISRSQAFVNIHCPPVPCWNNAYTSTIEADGNSPVVFQYCVIDHLGLQEVVLIDGAAILANAKTWNRRSGLQVNLHKMELYNYLTVIFHNVTADAGLSTWYITVVSNSTRKLDFVVDIKAKYIGHQISSGTTLWAISLTLFILSTLFAALSIWLIFFKGKTRLLKIMPSSTRSSQVKLNLY